MEMVGHLPKALLAFAQRLLNLQSVSYFALQQLVRVGKFDRVDIIRRFACTTGASRIGCVGVDSSVPSRRAVVCHPSSLPAPLVIEICRESQNMPRTFQSVQSAPQTPCYLIIRIAQQQYNIKSLLITANLHHGDMACP
jgi:hypothetical protein